MKKLLFILFAVMCIIQWVVPGMMIYNSEKTIANGTLFKFKTEPIDPSDPFRGKYITLQFESDFILFNDSIDFHTGEEIFVTFETDSSGFAVADEIYKVEPESESYLRTTVDFVVNHRNNHRVEFDLPFDRFYLEESKALKAEELHRAAQRDSVQLAYALVSIGAGHAVIKDVIINDKPILDLIKAHRQDKSQ
jgi:uncharacterized membrane-anchored protein